MLCVLSFVHFLFHVRAVVPSLRERLKKQGSERDRLESQLKNERDERDRYKVGMGGGALSDDTGERGGGAKWSVWVDG